MGVLLTAEKRLSYALVPLALVAAAHWHLGAALIAGLFAGFILRQGERGLRDAGAPPLPARWAALALFVLLAGLIVTILVAFARIGLSRLPVLLDRVLPRVNDLAARLGAESTLTSVEDLRGLILETAKDNVRSITAASGLLTRGFFQIVAAVAVVVLRFLAAPPPRPPRGGGVGLIRECEERGTLFAASFELVMGAQVVIAAINAGVTAVFLFAAGIPFRSLLILATFLFGMIPIAGNIASNALIVAAALARSDRLALLALAFLIAIHKVEYFLNGRIVGARTEIPMWATLAGLLIGEAVMGATGVILAPTLIHYAREELRASSIG